MVIDRYNRKRVSEIPRYEILSMNFYFTILLLPVFHEKYQNFSSENSCEVVEIEKVYTLKLISFD